MRKLLLVLLMPCSVSAAPFMYSDPWPADSQPDTCVAVEGSATIPLTLFGSPKQIKHDMNGVQSGEHTYTVTCSNIWGSSSPVNFTFRAGAPSAPAGLRIAP